MLDALPGLQEESQQEDQLSIDDANKKGRQAKNAIDMESSSSAAAAAVLYY